MQIMSLNGWGGTLHEALLSYVGKASPDILCLQEVVHTPAAEQERLTYRDGDHILPQRANFYLEVCQALPDHVACFCPAAQGVLWAGAVPIPSQWGLATFVRRSLPIIGQVQGFVHKDYSPFGYGEHPRSRNAHGVRVFDESIKRTISVTHMHGLRDLNGKMDTPEREIQARRLLEYSSTVSKDGDLRVICGDFNVEPRSETLKILSNAGFVEMVMKRGFSSTRSSHYKKSGRFADYMLIDDEAAATDFQVVYDPEVSDHCPLVLHVGG